MLLKFDGCKFVFILLFGIFLFRILEFLLIIFLIWLFCGCGIWVGCDGVIKEFLLLVVFCCLYLVLMNLVVFINFRVFWLFVYKNLWYFNIFFFFVLWVIVVKMVGFLEFVLFVCCDVRDMNFDVILLVVLLMEWICWIVVYSVNENIWNFIIVFVFFIYCMCILDGSMLI